MATPIGNLRDITLRALDLLKSVDVVAAEDTRVARKLLSHFGIATRTVSVHRHNERASAQGLLQLLAQGQSVALVSDAGTPGLSDPGAAVVRAARQAGYRVVPLPGPSALAAVVSVSGFAQTRFLFCGFLPQKKGERAQALAALAQIAEPMVFYEAPHRVADALQDMAAAFGSARRVVIARELTKLFEEVHETQLGLAGEWLAQRPERCRGEFVLMVQGAAGGEDDMQAAQRVLEILLGELPLTRAVSLAARITGTKRNALYRRALELQERKD